MNYNPGGNFDIQMKFCFKEKKQGNVTCVGQRGQEGFSDFDKQNISERIDLQSIYLSCSSMSVV